MRFEPLLLILLLGTVDLRGSSANPINTQHGGSSDTLSDINGGSSDTLSDIGGGSSGTFLNIDGAKIYDFLKKPEEMLEQGVVIITNAVVQVLGKIDGAIRSKRLDKAIEDLENLIDDLPQEIGLIHKKVMRSLYKSQQSIIDARATLEILAINLKHQCEQLLKWYNKRDLDNRQQLELYKNGTLTFEQVMVNLSIVKEMDSLRIHVTRFLKLAEIVLDQLTKAEEEYKLARGELIQSKEDMEFYSHQLEMKERTHTSGHKNEIQDKWDMCHILTIFTVGLAAPICYPIISGQTATLEDKIYEFKSLVDSIQGQLDEMKNENDDLVNFINLELKLIKQWETQLKQAVANHEDLTAQKIISGMKGEVLQDSIRVLRDTCIEYIKHNLPEVLQSSQ